MKFSYYLKEEAARWRMNALKKVNEKELRVRAVLS